jgi:selenocysteine lyase/cysteine desulfurase
MSINRRSFFKASAAIAGLHAVKSTANEELTRIAPSPGASPHELVKDEGFWSKVAAQFDIDRKFINLENGYYGIMPQPVYQSYLQNTLRLNRENSLLLRSGYKIEAEQIRKQLAETMGISPEEIALTRGGTEALQNLITGYNKLKPGDQVMYADLDYYSCQYAFDWLQERRGVSLVKIVIPEPATKQAVLDVYAQALDAYPRLKLMLLSHLNNRTGLVCPVAEITTMARAKGVDVIVDAAHSWGQVDFNVEDLQADFVGFSLHKWIHAPLGLGCLYVRRSRIMDVDKCFSDDLFAKDDIRSRVHSGTLNVAPLLTLPAALDYHLALGGAVKEARLRYLRNHWVSRVTTSSEAFEILTPNEPEMHAGITSFRIAGRPSKADNDAIVKYLMDKHRIFTVARGGIHKGNCVRVTPALFTSFDDVDYFASALLETANSFR